LRLANGRQDVGRQLRRLRSVSYEQTSDLPLHPRVTTTELGWAERLHPRRDVRRVEGSSSMFSVLAR
jgi:hypothetical protein